MNEESEQNEIPNYESSVGGRVRDTRAPPNKTRKTRISIIPGRTGC